jgi:hypothetical protein
VWVNREVVIVAANRKIPPGPPKLREGEGASGSGRPALNSDIAKPDAAAKLS